MLKFMANAALSAERKNPRPLKSSVSKGKFIMIDTRENAPLYDSISKAVEMGASGLEIEYKDGYEEIVALSDNIGFGIGRLKSDSKEATDLRKELYEIAKRKKKIIKVADKKIAVSVKISDSFGVDEFHVTFTGS